MKKETVANLFELAVATERIMQDYYQGLGKKFSNFSKVSNFWQDMASDENQHVTALKKMRDSLSDNLLLSEADPSVAQQSHAFLEKFPPKDTLNSVKTLDDAYEFAHDMESSEANAVFKFLTAKFIKPEKRMKIVIAMIENHIAKIMDFSDTFGNAEWRKSIVGINK